MSVTARARVRPIAPLLAALVLGACGNGSDEPADAGASPDAGASGGAGCAAIRAAVGEADDIVRRAVTDPAGAARQAGEVGDTLLREAPNVGDAELRQDVEELGNRLREIGTGQDTPSLGDAATLTSAVRSIEGRCQ